MRDASYRGWGNDISATTSGHVCLPALPRSLGEPRLESRRPRLETREHLRVLSLRSSQYGTRGDGRRRGKGEANARWL